MNRHVLGKNLDVFPQKSKIFLHILMIILKIDVTLKSFSAMQFFNFCKLNFSLKLSLLLNNFIRVQSLLFDLIETRGRYKQVIKIWVTIDCYFIKIYKMMLLCRLHFKLRFQKVTSHSFPLNDYKTLLQFSLEFLQQCLLV